MPDLELHSECDEVSGTCLPPRQLLRALRSASAVTMNDNRKETMLSDYEAVATDAVIGRGRRRCTSRQDIVVVQAGKKSVAKLSSPENKDQRLQGTRAHSAFRRQWQVLTAAALLLAMSVWWVDRQMTDPRRSSRPLRIGYQESLPYQVVAPDGAPSGPAVEIVREAAKRAHISLEWVYAPGRSRTKPKKWQGRSLALNR